MGERSLSRKQTIDVLHVIGSLSTGGAERNLCYLAPFFHRSELSYGICCLIRRGEFADEVEEAGVPVFDLRFRMRSSILSILRLAALLRKKKVKVLHTHLFTTGVVGRLAALLAGVPVVITHEHGNTPWKRWHHTMFERWAIHFTDLRIAVSQEIMDMRIEQEGTPRSKMCIVPNAVEPTRFEVDDATRHATRQEIGLDDCFIIGRIGRLVESKCHDLLLDAAREVCGKKPEVRFILVGDGPSTPGLERLRESYGLTGKVHFLGRRTDVPELLAAIDLYVITSRWEGLPLALLEAMMAGKPIISTSVGAIPGALRDNEDGILIRPNCKEDLVESLLALIDDPQRMRLLGANARKRAMAKFSPGVVLGELEDIYRKILAGKGIELGSR
jgi:glycosyltransferase involved in cell wall biosynthesis